MTSTIWQLIAHQTNLFALQSLGEERYAEWVQVTVDELKAYIGFMILMGIVKLPSIYDYWQTSEIFHYSPIASRISRDRFSEISRYLHFVDNTILSPPGTQEYDRLGKVRGILDMFKAQFLAIHKEVSIYEAMVAYKGRSSMKQYLPKKPIKRGFKIWMRADAVNGYVSEFSVYTGKVKDAPGALGGNVVRALSENLQHKNYHLYIDNFSSSVALMINLLKLGLYSCGTLRVNRKGFPSDLKSMAKKGTSTRGESKTKQFKNVTVSVWQDTKPVVVIATNSDPTESTTVLRKLRDGTRKQFASPTAIDLYNKNNMGGVDFSDQMRGYYHFRLKCRKNYKYLFWFIINVAIVNAYILYTKHTDLQRKNMKDFRVRLALGLIGDYCSRKRPGRPSKKPPRKRFCSQHFPVRGADSPHRCHHCQVFRQQRRRTVWFCKDCDLYLCHTGKEDDCFFLYHTQHGPNNIQ